MARTDTFYIIFHKRLRIRARRIRWAALLPQRTHPQNTFLGNESHDAMVPAKIVFWHLLS
jgi:hypothetical protein